MIESNWYGNKMANCNRNIDKNLLKKIQFIVDTLKIYSHYRNFNVTHFIEVYFVMGTKNCV